MLLSLYDTFGYHIRATDGDVGTIDDVLFDDVSSTVRYLVVDTGGWLSSRKVVLTPAALGAVEPGTRQITTALTREQVERSPDLDLAKPVSRQQEEALHQHYGWAPYWGGVTAYGLAPYWGGVPLAADRPRSTASDPVEHEVAAAEQERADPHLRSAREVIGYYVAATDGEIGHVEDLLADPEDWVIRYVVIDTRNWLPGRKVLVATDWLASVQWSEQRITVDLTRDQVKASPEYDPSITLDRQFQEQLYRHHGRVPYWV
jgi:uncharacterized protein YrrD